ncbi:MAG: Fur family transcriptional regulator [Candidatus Nanopelagicales bacterium]
MLNAEHDLRERGLRVTAQRLAVLQVLSEARHVSADYVATAVRTRAGAASTQGIYNVVNDLVGAGLVQRIDIGGGPALYELAAEGPHHHLMCRKCSRVVDLPCDHGIDSCLMPPEQLGFADIEAEIVFWGTCAECQKEVNKQRRGK